MKKIIGIVLICFYGHSFAKTEIATFAGGCFWCMEWPFEQKIGVKKVISGYSGGQLKNPTYKQVSSGKTKHIEAVQVHFNPEIISYKELLEIFWKNIDPTDKDGQFVDKGYQYTSAIIYHNDDQKKMALTSLELLKKTKKFKDIVTPITSYKNFYPAEAYHQDYYKKNPLTIAKYKYYRAKSGRDNFLNKHWKEHDLLEWKVIYKRPKDSEIKKKLSKLQYNVTQNDETEEAFNNIYWKHKEVGIYVDIVSLEPLFSSKDKYKSGTGWPSFTKPIDPFYLIEVFDDKLFSKRVEIRSRIANSHLGHVFKDGPRPLGLRYCMNSAALKFIPKDQMKSKGYEQYLSFL